MRAVEGRRTRLLGPVSRKATELVSHTLNLDVWGSNHDSMICISWLWNPIEVP